MDRMRRNALQRKNILTILISCYLSLFLLFSGCNKSPSHRILQAIPEQDQETLSSFFQLLFCDDNFSYTLFGNKPMSIGDFFSSTTLWALNTPGESLIFEKGWKVWESYASLFPSDEFVLKRCESKKSNWKILSIFLIHKKHALKAIRDNLDTFQEVLGHPVNPQQLLQELCDPHKDIMETLSHNSLFGILLGYGKVNAMNFERKVTICDQLNAKMTPPFSGHHDMEALQPASQRLVQWRDSKTFCYPSEDCLPASENDSLAEELNEILTKGDGFELYGSDYFLDKFTPPMFIARNHSRETEKLHADYLATKQKLHRAYLQGSFLEVTLNQWMDPK
jgi:hypothetical protein